MSKKGGQPVRGKHSEAKAKQFHVPADIRALQGPGTLILKELHKEFSKRKQRNS
jgi:hypothetical protein